MISRLRRKIILVLMTVMCIFLAVILGFSLFSVRRSYISQTRRFMGVHMEKENRMTPYQPPVAIATQSESGEITIESNHISDLTEEKINGYIGQLAETENESGEIGSEHLTYLRHPGKNGTVYVFADTQTERAFALSQVQTILLVSALAVILFLITSFLLAQWLVRPVSSAWNKQRQFIADASHELKTPLTVILSNTAMLTASGVITDVRNAQRLDNIRAESQRMRSLVESLLSLARSDSAPKVAPKTLINLSYQVSSAVLTLEPTVYDSGHQLVSNIKPDLYVYASAQDITQMIEILIDNACKYSLAGSEICLQLDTVSKKEVLLDVSSFGTPLTRQECKAVFERFYRTDTSREAIQGYGLGLSIAAEIAARHGGSISAESDGKSRNTFHIRLPLTQAREPQSETDGSPQ
ncbi:MAG: HAMP domain-containing histidine kinase [Clostridia bacterium]|nr:HAMP domain-containing histidine kinase [Clostridia bacterium]